MNTASTATTVVNEALLQELLQALRSERDALLGRDPEAIKRAAMVKMGLLDRLLKADRHGLSSAPDLIDQLQIITDLNRANGELMAKRRRELEWTLSQLGRLDDGCGYTSKGDTGHNTTARALGYG